MPQPPELRHYQKTMGNNLIRKLLSGIRKVIGQLATGGGKTVVFANLTYRYITANPGKSVLILVHRIELLNSARKTIYNHYGIAAQPIKAGMRHVPMAKVYVGMVDSVNKRVEKLPDLGMVIIDEAHRKEFHKMHAHFPTQHIIGFTATPLAASKKDPLKNHYDDIECGIDIPELIEINKSEPDKGLVQNVTWVPKGVVDRAELAKAQNGIIGNDFNEGLMSLAFSKPKYVNNTVDAYEKYAPHTKAIVFNCNIEHSIIVQKAFIAKGYQCKHLDGETPTVERTHILNWFKTTPGAILCNVDIATTGFDEPSIETVIVNRSTMSLVLWLQMCGRGSRPWLDKLIFNIIDMGGNGSAHGDWNFSRNWKDIFFNPPKPGKPKDCPAPVKNCPACDALLPVQVRFCYFCGYEFPGPAEVAEGELGEFIVITKGINVTQLVQSARGAKHQAVFYGLAKRLAEAAAATVDEMTDDRAAVIVGKFMEKMKELPAVFRSRTYSQSECKNALYEEIQKRFKKWVPQEPIAPVQNRTISHAVNKGLPPERIPIRKRTEPQLQGPVERDETKSFQVEFPDFDQFNDCFKMM